jgi:hypothetical protein
VRRSLPLLACALTAIATAATAAAAGETATDRRPAAEIPDFGSFRIACAFSHRNQDDPIVYPRRPGRSHDHTYFGNRTTDAFSTPSSLRAAGRTSCRIPEDTAAYWAPTLFRDGRPVEPLGAVAYYARRTLDQVDPFPPGLRMIAGNAAARSPQSRRITYWSCGIKGAERSSTVPTCRFGGGGILQLHVNFPDCWDGDRLDSADHRSHMAYSRAGECPLSHPVELPGLSLVAYYAVSGASDVELASGGQLSGHADFVNSWQQRALRALVDRYLNGPGFGRRP